MIFSIHCIRCYCAAHTLDAQIAPVDAFSGHADKNELKRYVQALTGDLKKISVIHGEESQCLAFAETMRGLKPHAEVLVPQYKQMIEA